MTQFSFLDTVMENVNNLSQNGQGINANDLMKAITGMLQATPDALAKKAEILENKTPGFKASAVHEAMHNAKINNATPFAKNASINAAAVVHVMAKVGLNIVKNSTLGVNESSLTPHDHPKLFEKVAQDMVKYGADPENQALLTGLAAMELASKTLGQTAAHLAQTPAKATIKIAPVHEASHNMGAPIWELQ